MDTIPVGRAVLQKVVAKLGGFYEAAQRLGVPHALVSRYLDGRSPVPDAILLRALDIALDEFQQDPYGASKPFNRSDPTPRS